MSNDQWNQVGRDQWNDKAAFWDNLHGDAGNRFHQTLVSPAVETLLALSPGERVLDIACGSGQMARRLAELGAAVTAVDFSPALIEKARARSQAGGEPIVYGVADATNEAELAALGEGGFDAVVCTMALMDMPVIAPLYRAARRLLRDGGRLVVATAHPAFNSNNPIFFAEMTDENGTLVQTIGVKIRGYLDIPPTQAAGAPNEPNAHNYYHRPLHELLGEAFAAGLVVDGIEEPAFPADQFEPAKMLGWLGVPQIPPVLGVRFRKAS
jgi:2-polyprenyl-3-methyl-5-hydroxy-6-metoxy-1,4-benzoquinol methylase